MTKAQTKVLERLGGVRVDPHKIRPEPKAGFDFDEWCERMADQMYDELEESGFDWSFLDGYEPLTK